MATPMAPCGYASSGINLVNFLIYASASFGLSRAKREKIAPQYPSSPSGVFFTIFS